MFIEIHDTDPGADALNHVELITVKVPSVIEKRFKSRIWQFILENQYVIYIFFLLLHFFYNSLSKYVEGVFIL